MTEYTGSCHCGAVQIKVDCEPDKVFECNCSICRRAGWKLVFVPADKFELLKGADALRDYQFHKEHIHHKFCTTCGIRPFSHGKGPDGAESYSVNVRCLDGFDYLGVPTEHFDGAAI